MGEVIQFPGNHEHKKTDVGEVSELHDAEVVDLHAAPNTRGFSDLLADMEAIAPEGILSSREQAVVITRLLADSPVSPTTRREMEMLVSGYTREQIAGLLNDSNVMDWQKNPAFYLALAHQRLADLV